MKPSAAHRQELAAELREIAESIVDTRTDEGKALLRAAAELEVGPAVRRSDISHCGMEPQAWEETFASVLQYAAMYVKECEQTSPTIGQWPQSLALLREALIIGGIIRARQVIERDEHSGLWYKLDAAGNRLHGPFQECPL